MADKKSILVVGFNSRPLTHSLNKAGYEVFAVDFFGDLDLYPNVKDYLIVSKKLDTNYLLMKEIYSEYLVKLTLEMLEKYSNIDYLLIGSGLDDAYIERHSILTFIKEKQLKIKSVNNDVEVMKKARNLNFIYSFLRDNDFETPKIYPLNKQIIESNKIKYPIVLKKKASSGGINIFKCENKEKLLFMLQFQQIEEYNYSNWLIQEYIEGIPISCTTISNGKECEILTINRQIIGEKFVNAPKEFIYCGNVVPANLLKDDNELIKKISKILTIKLGLKGINGFDLILKMHQPYLMEINPRIPGSIRASECVLNLNLLDLHVKSFFSKNWERVKQDVKAKSPIGYATKLIIYAPNEVNKEILYQINNMKYIHDKTDPVKSIQKNEPICTILYKGKDFAESYFGALKIVDKIKEFIN